MERAVELHETANNLTIQAIRYLRIDPTATTSAAYLRGQAREARAQARALLRSPK